MIQDDKKDESAAVYMIWQSDSSFYKIGYTANLKKKLSELQMGNAKKLFIIATLNSLNPEGHERRFHEYWSSNRLEGEWFSFDPLEVVEVVAQFQNASPSFKKIPTRSKINRSRKSPKYEITEATPLKIVSLLEKKGGLRVHQIKSNVAELKAASRTEVNAIISAMIELKQLSINGKGEVNVNG